MTTSSYPSPFTSPAEATEVPKEAYAWWGQTAQSGAVEGPVAEPRNRNAAPASPGPYNGAPTTTSSYPSPFTSPAEATEVPKEAFLSWPSTTHSEVALGRLRATSGRPTMAAVNPTSTRRVIIDLNMAPPSPGHVPDGRIVLPPPRGVKGEVPSGSN